MKKEKTRINRREFLQTGAMTVMAVGAVPMAQPQKEAKGKKEQKPDTGKILNYQPDMRYRRLGSTDIYFSVLSLGGINIEKSVAHRAVDLGVNLVHMSSGYNGGKAILELVDVLKTKRNKVYIAYKDSFFKGSLDDINPVLKALGIDCIDFIMFNRHKADRVNDPVIRERFEAWKKQGKVRYAGLTSHDDVKACVAAGIESGLYSVIHPALAQPDLELMDRELKKAAEKGIGIMAMKTMKGIDNPELQTAFVKKLLASPAITTINKAFTTFDLFDRFHRAARETLTAQEDFSLYRYAQQNRANNCMMCGSCEHVCPQGIEISTLLRSKLYYHDQLGDRETAIEAYRELTSTQWHDGNCLACGKCESVCPNGIRIVQKLNAATEWFRNLSRRDLA